MALSKDSQRDAAFVKLMHGKSAEQRSAFMSMLKKDADAHRIITEDYVRHWEFRNGVAKDTESAREGRKKDYMNVVNNYYDLATDLYEQGWAQSFHLCRFGPNEPLLQALARHEHYLAHKLNIQEHSTVLDIGCGVGGPAREIASFANCNVVGVNNNSYQIERATAYASAQNLADKVTFVKSDFMHLPFEEASFDAVYAVEATVHAPSLEGVYAQMFRVLKPGGSVGIYEWVMTDRYDDGREDHRAVRLGIERGNGIANMATRETAEAALRSVGFEILHLEDLAERKGNDVKAWYSPLTGEWSQAYGAWDMVSCLRLTSLGRWSVETLLGALETLKMAPPGTRRTAKELAGGADALVAGGKQGLFTPMYLMIARKPVSVASERAV